MPRQTAVVLSLALVFAAPLAAQRRPVTATDYYRLIAVGDVAVAPSGRQVAFEVTTVIEDRDRRHTELWLAAADGSVPPYRLTNPATESAAPVFSPDGALLAFTSRRDTAGAGGAADEAPVWFLRLGPNAGEAFQVPGVNGTPAWSPDGRTIAYLWGGPSPDTGRANRRRGWVAPNAITRGPDPRRFDGRVITSVRYKGDGRGFLPDPATVPPRHLYVVPAAGGEPRRLTDGALSQSAIAWSPDGRFLAYVEDSTDQDELREDAKPDIYLVEVASRAVRRLVATPGYQRSPAFSPDGRSVGYLCSAGRGQPTDVCVVGVDGGPPRNLTPQWDLQPNEPRWAEGGRALLFDAETQGNVHQFRVEARGGVVRQVTQGERQLRGFSASADGAVMAYVSSDIAHPTELFVAAGNGTGERRLTSFNDAFLASVELAPTDTIWYRGPGGLPIEGWLMKPVGWQAGRRYPLYLSVHGGPHGQYGNVYFHEFQLLAGQGYWVLFTNPRGSTGYGHDFLYATRGRWGMEDYQDLMLGVDEAIRRTGQVDTTRLAVGGGSYGGFMTNWIIGHTTRFRAAESDRAISNWYSWYGSSDAQGLTEYEFYGPPWEQDSLYRALSPFTYIQRIRTPVLIVHSEEDYRVPITDAEQLFMALKKRRVPVEFVRYPRSSHGLSRNGPPWLLVDRLERMRTWFAYWLGDGAGAAVGGRE